MRRAGQTAKLQISLKEYYDTEYWLQLFEKTALIAAEQTTALRSQCGTIRSLLIASVNTAKGNGDKH